LGIPTIGVRRGGIRERGRMGDAVRQPEPLREQQGDDEPCGEHTASHGGGVVPQHLSCHGAGTASTTR
jgi:hypothetical protein